MSVFEQSGAKFAQSQLNLPQSISRQCGPFGRNLFGLEVNSGGRHGLLSRWLLEERVRVLVSLRGDLLCVLVDREVALYHFLLFCLHWRLLSGRLFGFVLDAKWALESRGTWELFKFFKKCGNLLLGEITLDFLLLSHLFSEPEKGKPSVLEFLVKDVLHWKQ